MIYQVFILIRGSQKKSSEPGVGVQVNQGSFIQDFNQSDVHRIYQNDIATCKQRTYKLLFQLIQMRDEAVKNYARRNEIEAMPKYEVPFLSQWIEYADLQKRIFIKSSELQKKS